MMVKQWKLGVGLLGLWLLVILYMTRLIPGNSQEGTSRTERSLLKALEDLDKLHAQNQELTQIMEGLKVEDPRDSTVVKDLEARLEKANKQLQDLRAQASSGLSQDEEKARRKVEYTSRELWYFINAQLKKVKDKKSGVVTNITGLLLELKDYRRTMEDDFKRLREANNKEEWRAQKSRDLGDLVQRRLEYLQNPKDCDAAKKVTCNLHKGCGFGCQLHHVTYCLIAAYALQRTMVLDSKGWRYSTKGWEGVFYPVSNTCRYKGAGTHKGWGGTMKEMEKYQIIDLPIVDSLHPRPNFMPLAIPEDLEPELSTFHGDPGVWWIGQMVRYLFRPNDKIAEDIATSAKKMGFKNVIVGVHVRRTDKINLEAAFHGIEEYMKHVEEYYDQLERTQPGVKRRVYLASDDPSVLPEAKKKYLNYSFISDNLISKTASLGTRYTDSSLRGIILDVYFLSRCDFLVCTFSSQVCRVAYELMQTLHGDASQNFRSLDDVFYFGGQNAHNVKVLQENYGKGKGFLDMKPGDAIGIAGNHWDGFSKGTNRKTGQMGLYPTFKVENSVLSVSMPKYPQVPLKKEKTS